MIYLFVLILRAMFFMFAALVVASFVLLWFAWQGLCILAVLAAGGVDGYVARKQKREAEGKKAPQARFSNRR